MGCGDIKEVLSTKPMVIGRGSKGQGSQERDGQASGFTVGGSRELGAGATWSGGEAVTPGGWFGLSVA